LKPKQKSEKKGVKRGVLGGRKGEGKLPAPSVLIVFNIKLIGMDKIITLCFLSPVILFSSR